MSSDYIHADETGISVPDNAKKGKRHRGYLWVYNNSIEKLLIFDYRPGRGKECAEGILKEYKGYLQTAGYTVYEDIGKQQGIALFHCMVHARGGSSVMRRPMTGSDRSMHLPGCRPCTP